jgi:DNA primase
MRGLIPESFIEELLARTDIVEVIERRVPLKRAGSEFQSVCPFHEEKTPSFTVSPRKQFYHCFGCGAHGSAIGFLMQFEGLEFRDVIEDLARQAGLQVPESAGQPQPKRTGLYEIMERAASFYQAKLKEHPPAIEYLKGRGLSGEICRDFGIGYAPAGWHQLQEHIGSKSETVDLLRRGGMLSSGEKSEYDKFRDRIMFPIHDRRGRVIGFGGRATGDDGPKYLNSPETELFHKGRELYGLYLARQRVGRLDEIVVVEGYMDVVALAQNGIRNTVATLGTATTTDQAALLLRAADVVVYCFDGDPAGRKAAWRALEATLPKLVEGKQARFLFLPDGEDPDSLIRKIGPEAFNDLISEAQPLSEFLFNRLSADVAMDSLDGRARLVQSAMPLLETLPEGVFRDMMLERLEQLARYRIRPGETSPAETSSRPAAGRRPGSQRTPMRMALAHLVQNPGLAELAVELEELRDSDIQGADVLVELVDFCRQRPNMTTAQLLELMHQNPAHPHLARLAFWQLPGDSETLTAEFLDTVNRLRLQQVQISLSKRSNFAQASRAEKEEYLALQRHEQALKNSIQGRTS